MKATDEFYIGWQDRAPVGLGSRTRQFVVVLLLVTVALATILAAAQRTIGTSVFEWGTVKEFAGIFRASPYPHLLVTRPRTSGGQPTFSSYHLVKPFKFGLDAGTVVRFDGRSVTLKGTLIYRGDQTMVEVADDSIQLNGDSEADTAPVPSPVSIGRQTLVGEIVDSKCYLGVMNPGQLTTHRACAIRCISGGIPPALLVRQAGGSALYLLLVAKDGSPVNKQVLDLVAEPVEITGDVERQGDLLVMRSDPGTYRRLAR